MTTDITLRGLGERAEGMMRRWFVGNEGKSETHAKHKAFEIAAQLVPEEPEHLAFMLTNDPEAWTIAPAQGEENILRAVQYGVIAYVQEAAMGEWEYRHNEHTGNWPEVTYADWQTMTPSEQAAYPEFLAQQEAEDREPGEDVTGMAHEPYPFAN